jgi:hypothetical protein
MPTQTPNSPSKLKAPPPVKDSSRKLSQLLQLPVDIQVNLLTYLRAYDLAGLQQTCTYYRSPQLVNSVVLHFAESIYPEEFTRGFYEEATTSSTTGSSKPPAKKSPTKHKLPPTPELYNFAHLRNMEIIVVARVLNSPEPATGFFVSKSWCKTALRWLEIQQEPRRPQQKLSKKKQRMRDRKLSDASPPWADANIDILCEHHNLQRCSNSKSSRARRRLLDRQAWKILKKLYPDSTQLSSNMGECLQCTVEAETAKKSELDRVEQGKLERKRPLTNEDVRRFYMRRNGVPSQAVSESPQEGLSPLIPGKYYVLPRAWCYSWRRYIKTGEGGPVRPPDASDLLCHAHRLASLPPHLEAYVHGESPELLASCGTTVLDSPAGVAVAAAAYAIQPPANLPPPVNFPFHIPGQGPDPEVLQAMREAGFQGSPTQVSRQLSLFREMEDIRRLPAPQPAAAITTATKNELLDRENHAVVEILTEAEYTALEKEWPNSQPGFGLCFAIDKNTHQPVFLTTQLCRECDATGRPNQLHIKHRARSVVRKSTEKSRVLASLEY